MLTVMELLSNPLFHNFTLVSGRSGLNNEITGTGIFDWESSSDVEKDFMPGEFVVTTLSQAKNDAVYAENCLRMLIQKKVSAIAVKSIYFKDISTELRSYSDDYKIPVFFFSETFFDDIIYLIKNSLLTRTNHVYDDAIQILTSFEHTQEEKKHAAKEINPFFFPNIICCYYSGKKPSGLRGDLKNVTVDTSHTVYSAIKYQQGVLIIYTARTVTGDAREELLDFLGRLEIKKRNYYIGISNPVKGLENLGNAIQESLFANSSCLIDQEEILSFNETGLDQLLMPLRNDICTKNYYERFLAKIIEYDAKHSVKLMDTLLEYVRNNGDIKLTAQKMFQHGNTIRYRIGKVKKLLEMDDSTNSFIQLFVLIRLYEIYQKLDQ